MMIRGFLIGMSLFLLLLYGCGTSNPTLATYGTEIITLQSFEDDYADKNNGWDSCAVTSLEERQKFLDLLIKYKLKVKEARAQGLEKDSAVVDETQTYQNAVIESFLIENEVVKPGVQLLYNRKKEEVRASHILFRVPLRAPAKDSAAAYERALKAIEQIPTIPFDSLAWNLSEDPGAKKNYGDMGYFTAGRMVREFEDACFSLRPGEYTKKPVRTQFGYHVIKVTGRRNNAGSVRLSHILLRFNESSSDSAAIRDTAWSIYNRIKNGEDFYRLMLQFSKDPQSIQKNGDIGFYDLERIPPAVANTFNTLPINSVAEPVWARYGYHIFRLTEKKPFPEFKELAKDLKTQYQSSRYQGEYKEYLASLRKRYAVLVDTPAVMKLIAAVDSTMKAGEVYSNTSLPSAVDSAIVLRASSSSMTAKEFIRKAESLPDYKNHVFNAATIWTILSTSADGMALTQHAQSSRSRYPELQRRLKEFDESVLLFRIEQDEVTTKAVVSDSIQREYYNAHQQLFRWPERVNFAEIYMIKDSAIQAVAKRIKKGMDFAAAAQQFTERAGYKEKRGEWGLQAVSSNDLAKRAARMQKDSVTAPFRHQSGWVLLKCLEKDSSHVKTFEEALPEVTSACQEIVTKQREQEWVEQLKRKYPVTVNQEVLQSTFKRKRSETR